MTLTIVAAVALAGCARRHDPCDAASFNAPACQEAIRAGGYYYNGRWYASHYSHPYPYYYDSYNTYVSRGGSVHSSGSYSHPSSSGVTRGGFGSSAHSSGA